MGREIYAQLRDIDEYDEKVEDRGKQNPHVAWDSEHSPGEKWICGFDEATNLVAHRANEHGYLLLEGTDLEYLRKELESKRAHDQQEVLEHQKYLQDLCVARKNARNYKEFSSFDEPIEEYKRWLEENSWSRAASLLDLINEILREYNSCRYDAKFKPYLVVSE